MTTATISQTIQSISDDAPAIQDTRIINTINVGQGIRQGDIYIVRINSNTTTTIKSAGQQPRIYNIDPTLYTCQGTNQLVPGFSMGSNHQVNQNQMVKVFINPINKDSLVGPIISAKEKFTVTHPQHAHFCLPAGDYQVFYQLNPVNQQRVQD